MSDKPDDGGGFCCAMAGMHMGHDEDCPNRICPTCHDGGMVPLGEHFITHEMALDAGNPDLEGMSMGIEWGICPDCGARKAALAAEPKLIDLGGGLSSYENLGRNPPEERAALAKEEKKP